jgi:CheY-like chemotaxis protein
MSKLHVLIIEDDEPTRYTLQDIFETSFPDFVLHMMETSCEYEEKLGTMSEDIGFAVVDLYLSVCPPGNVVVEWMKQQERFAKTIFLAFTADSVTDADVLLGAGFDAIIIKPIRDVELFVKQIQRVLAGESFVYHGMA